MNHRVLYATYADKSRRVLGSADVADENCDAVIAHFKNEAIKAAFASGVPLPKFEDMVETEEARETARTTNSAIVGTPHKE